MYASFIHRALNFRYLEQTRKVPIQTLVNRIFVTQHHSKARVTFAYVSYTLIISSHLALGPPVGVHNRYPGIGTAADYISRFQVEKFKQNSPGADDPGVPNGATG